MQFYLVSDTSPTVAICTFENIETCASMLDLDGIACSQEQQSPAQVHLLPRGSLYRDAVWLREDHAQNLGYGIYFYSILQTDFRVLSLTILKNILSTPSFVNLEVIQLLIHLTLYRTCQFWVLPISAANKDMVSYIDKWGYNFLIEKKTLWEKKKLLVTSNFFFSHNVFNSCMLLMH